jgi:SAM-dependent methyltransferase
MSKENAILEKLSHVPYHLAKDLCQGKSILDAACGDGETSNLLLSFGAAKVVGVDLSVELIKKAQDDNFDQKLKFHVANVEQLEHFFENDKFDIIISNQTIEHVVDVEHFVASLKYLIKEDGTIIISCPNESDLADSLSFDNHHTKFSYESFVHKLSVILDMPYVIIGSYPISGVINLDISGEVKQTSHAATIIQDSYASINRTDARLFTAVFSRSINFEPFIDLDVHSQISWSSLVKYDYLNELKINRDIFELKQRSLISEALRIELEFSNDVIWRLNNECEVLKSDIESLKYKCSSLKYCVKQVIKLSLKKILPIKIINFIKKS